MCDCVCVCVCVCVFPQDDRSEAVSAHGAILFGVVLVGLELLLCGYTHYAHQKVTARMGAVGGFKDVGKVLEVREREREGEGERDGRRGAQFFRCC